METQFACESQNCCSLVEPTEKKMDRPRKRAASESPTHFDGDKDDDDSQVFPGPSSRSSESSAPSPSTASSRTHEQSPTRESSMPWKVEEHLDISLNSWEEDIKSEPEDYLVENSTKHYEENEEDRDIINPSDPKISVVPLSLLLPDPTQSGHSTTLSSPLPYQEQYNDPIILRSDFTWSSNPQPKTPIPFIGDPGLKIKPTGNYPIDYFFLLFNREMFNLILEGTNNQAEHLSSQNCLPKSRIKSWKDVICGDLEVFLGLLYLSGQIRAPNLAHYWQTNSLYNFPIFKNAMGRDKFLLILRALYFANNSQMNEPYSIDPLYKIKPLIDLFHNRMKEIVYPTKELSLDESKILSGDRLNLQHDGHEYDIKCYMLSQSNGLVLKTMICCGSEDREAGGSSHVENVVKQLLDDYIGMGHSVYMDHYFSGVGLTDHLLQYNTYTTGTLNANKEDNPLQVVNKRLKLGEAISAYTDNGICVLKLREKTDVVVVSSEFGAEKVNYKSKWGKLIKKPEALMKYNENMGGVDRSDRLLAYYPCIRKTLRWYVKVGIHIFHIIMNNAFLLYNAFSPSIKLNLLEFRESVILSLIYKNRPQLYKPFKQPNAHKYHCPKEVPRNHANRKIRKRCAVCKQSGLRIESIYYCTLCPNQPGLCLERCFAAYHGYKQ